MSGNNRGLMEGIKNGLSKAMGRGKQQGGETGPNQKLRGGEAPRPSVMVAGDDLGSTSTSRRGTTFDSTKQGHVLQRIQGLKLAGSNEELKTPILESTVVDPPWSEAAEGRTVKTKSSEGQSVTYQVDRVVGKGSFGVVFQATEAETGDCVAIKKVMQDKRFKNRELQIMRNMRHTNVVSMRNYFYTKSPKEELYLNLILDFVPDTIYRVTKQYSQAGKRVPLTLVKLYVYQSFRSIAYIHSLKICHRDIKPQNLLVDPQTHVVKLCDFGSAKQLVKGEPNISYICSRYYRAPELIFGATEYTTAIDVWSVGCVMAELLIGSPLFPGESGVDQLIEIIKSLGTPTKQEINSMNPNYTEFKFPQIKGHSWNRIFGKREGPETIDFISRLLRYEPHKRYKALEACTHPFFDELRQENTKTPGGGELPPLFDFSAQELSELEPDLIEKLIPNHLRGVE